MSDAEITKPCPECGGRLVVRVNRQNDTEFLGCASYPVCTHTEGVPEYLRLRKLGFAELPGFGS